MTAPDHPVPAAPKALAWLLRGLAVVALALVFSWYLNPHFVVDMAARIWSCI